MNPKEYAARRLHGLGAAAQAQETKPRSTLTSTRDSLTGKIHIATPEESAAFDKHCRSYTAALFPVGILEQELAQEIAEGRWRLKRARSLENSIFAEGHHQHANDSPTGHPEVDAALAEGKTWIDQSRQLQLLTLYETRVRRAVEKNTVEFKAMQAERKAAYAEAQRKAILLYRVAQSEGKTYDPAPDSPTADASGGFEFSHAEIARVLDRDHRLRRALHLSD